jgi:hypothetical protein
VADGCVEFGLSGVAQSARGEFIEEGAVRDRDIAGRRLRYGDLRIGQTV